jgi:hypothetical protein
MHHIHDGFDERTRGEVLARAGLGILGILFEQAFVDLAFDIDIQPDPGFAVDQFDETRAAWPDPGSCSAPCGR